MNTHRLAEAAQTRTRTEQQPVSEVVRVRKDERAVAPRREEETCEIADDLYDNLPCTD